MKSSTYRFTVSIALYAIAVLLMKVATTSQTTSNSAELFDKMVVMIPMRDGVKLNTEIYIPKNMSAPLPILFNRTPYGLGHDADGFSPVLKGGYKELADDG